MNLQELNKLYMVLLEAEKINLDKSVRKKFNVKLITYLEEQFGDNCIVENALYSNVIGNYNFMVAKWGETSENNQ